MSAVGACVLRLTLVTSRGGRPKVEATLARGVESTGISMWKFDPEEFGIPVHLGADPATDEQFTLPASFVSRLSAALGAPERPDVLWLQLVEPFGYLALVPWEGRIWEDLGIAVVRLPTLTLARRKPTNSLQVAVLAAVPTPYRSSETRTARHGRRKAASPSSPRAWMPELDHLPALTPWRTHEFSARDVDVVVRAILSGSPRKTTVHVVTTPWIYHDLKALWRVPPREHWPVTLHDPYELRRAVHAARTPHTHAQIPWVRLLKAAQGGQQADVVHLLCHANVNDLKTRLVLADPLDESINVTSRYVSLAALKTTLDELGAWSLCLTTPRASGMAPQMRYVASRLTELRPGPILVTDLGTDPECAEIEQGYRFLYSQEPAPPPRVTRGMISCEPYRVQSSLNNALDLSYQVAAPPEAQPREAVAELITQENTPMWLAAAQRFVEQRQLDLSRIERDKSGPSLSPEAAALSEGIKKALTTIQDVLATYATRNRND